MENLVPLGTGNSRFMKSNISPSTTLAQLIQMLNNGTFPYDVGTINPAGISQQGTPLNKDTLFSAATQAKYPLTIETPNGALDKLANAVLYFGTQTPKYQEVTVDLSTAQEGDIVQLEENGKLADFYVAKLNYESGLNGAGRTLMVRKDCYDNQAWDNGGVNSYASSDLDIWFNGGYKNMLGAGIRSLIGTTKIRYTPGNGNNTVGTLERAVFALSATELGQSHANANTEGSALPIASTLRIAYRNGSATTQWTRSPRTDYTGRAWRLDSNGNIGSGSCGDSHGSRPAFTLPSTFTATYYVGTNGTVHDEQEYEEADSTTDVKGNPITIGTQIATGSYVGTGLSGESNSNELTFDFAPKFCVVTCQDDMGVLLVAIAPSPKASTYRDSKYGVTVTWSGNSMSWYYQDTGYGPRQCNANGHTYNYIAIG